MVHYTRNNILNKLNCGQFHASCGGYSARATLGRMTGIPTAVLWSAAFLLLFLGHRVQGQCYRRDYEYESFVCVCDENFCDEPGATLWPEPGTYTLYTSTSAGERFDVTIGDITTEAIPEAALVVINSTLVKNQIFGFGGAFTDSTGINIAALPEQAQENLLRAYFSSDGIEYNLCRVPIAGSDCSTRPYSYDDVEGDVDLVNWALEPEDYDYKLPFMKRANELSSSEIFYFGSPWSPPAWMKTSGMFNGSGELLPEMYQPYTDYIVKFVEAYETEGVRLWGLTTQNEPRSGYVPDWAWNTCGWTPEKMRDWIKNNLGPTMDAAGLGRLKIMIGDDTREALPDFPAPMLEDEDSNKYIDGVAVHWYSDHIVSPEVNIETISLDPTKFLLYTEGCEGFDVDDETSVMLGSWPRAERYFEDIIQNLNYFSEGWVDWNMALDTTGGPNWANNMLDAPIIVNKTSGEFYKQPSFYAMGHASKFIKRYGRSQETTTDGADLRVNSITNPDGTIVLLLLNKAEATNSVTIKINHGRFINTVIPAKSFQTFLISGS